VWSFPTARVKVGHTHFIHQTLLDGLLFVVRGEAYLGCNGVLDVEEVQPAYYLEAP
jgi:hypothetical protein